MIAVEGRASARSVALPWLRTGTRIVWAEVSPAASSIAAAASLEITMPDINTRVAACW